MKKILLLTIVLALTGCGGGGGGESGDQDGAAELFRDFAAAQAGGYRSVSMGLSNLQAQGAACGYADAVTLKDAEDYIEENRGSITASSDTKWCGDTEDNSFCLLRAGGSLITDDFYPGSPSERYVEIVVPGLSGNARSYFYIANTGSIEVGEVDIERPDGSIPSSGDCSPVSVSQVSTAINGNWSGYKVTYNPSSKAGTETTATMTCVGQSCTVGGESFGAIPFSNFQTVGIWRANWSGRSAGITMIESGNSISMFVCTAPLAGSIFDGCAFYAFSKS